jgi:hypothetical protein
MTSRIVFLLMLLSVNCFAVEIDKDLHNPPITLSVLIAEYDGLSEHVKKFLSDKMPNYTLFIKSNREKSIEEELSLIKGRIDLLEQKMKLDKLSEGL